MGVYGKVKAAQENPKGKSARAWENQGEMFGSFDLFGLGHHCQQRVDCESKRFCKQSV